MTRLGLSAYSITSSAGKEGALARTHFVWSEPGRGGGPHLLDFCVARRQVVVTLAANFAVGLAGRASSSFGLPPTLRLRPRHAAGCDWPPDSRESNNVATIRQFIQTNPARALELFSRLLDTSDKAIKTRERLFGELKDELELAVNLEEQHLFPVLKKHKETKDLVQEALSDNKQTRKLLSELEHTAKDDEDFLSKVAELRKAFQQHVRDAKKELLPAVQKALSDEEAETVLENIENEKAEIEAAKRVEADERREAARDEREQVESVQITAEGMASTVRSAADGAQRAARTAQDTVRTGL